MNIHNKIYEYINKYKSREYTEIDFHVSIESIIPLLLNEQHEFNVFLNRIENKLEEIDFTVDSDLRRQEYLKVIEKLEERIGP